MNELINIIMIKNVRSGELNINVNTLNHFIKKKDRGGRPAILKNRSKQINWRLSVDGKLQKKLYDNFKDWNNRLIINKIEE